MDEIDKKFEELLKKARETAGVETARRVQTHLNSYMRSKIEKPVSKRSSLTTSNTTD